MSETDYTAQLKDWPALRDTLQDVPAEDLTGLLAAEEAGEKRSDVMQALTAEADRRAEGDAASKGDGNEGSQAAAPEAGGGESEGAAAQAIGGSVREAKPALAKLSDTDLATAARLEAEGQNRKGMLDAIRAEQANRAEPAPAQSRKAATGETPAHLKEDYGGVMTPDVARARIKHFKLK